MGTIGSKAQQPNVFTGLKGLPYTADNLYKNRSIRPEQTWPNITLRVNIIFEEISALRRIRHIVSSKRVMVHIEM